MDRRLPTRRERQQMIGKTGRVTGRVAPGTTGEVHISVRGGTEAFSAFPANGTDTFEPGTKVEVEDFQAPRCVYVRAVQPA